MTSIGSVERIQVDGHRTDSKPKQGPSSIIVRIGGKTLDFPATKSSETVISQVLPERLDPELKGQTSNQKQAVAYTSKRSPDRNDDKTDASSWLRWKEAFRSGIIAGAFLGCLCMVLFHQIGVNRGEATKTVFQSANAVVPSVTSAMAPAPEEGTDVVLTIPSITVHVLEEGPFGSQGEAAKAARVKLNGTTGAVTGSGPFTVWRAVSLTGNGILKVQSKSSKDTMTAKVVTLSTKQVPLVLLPQGPDAPAITHWFSAEVSALRTLTGAAQGEMTLSDAVQSVVNADKSRPNGPLSSSAGVLENLIALNRTLDASGQSLRVGHAADAESELLQAWAQLFVIEQNGLSK